jgi:pimeloyl-ACP methyl ester carboxylesterase
MDEQFADVGRGITLCYDQHGSPDDEPLLLVMGLGTQMIAWPQGFIDLLVAEGFHVTRFDNRDIGRSTKLRHIRPPGLGALLTRSKAAGGYLLGDMAQDAVGLLDAIGIERAHVVGVSMGGMIAQTMAARHPQRVASLTSIMSTTGHRLKGQPALSVYPMLLRRPAPTPELLVERLVKTFARIGSPGFEHDEAELRHLIHASIQRSDGGDQAGTSRQMMAIMASGDRTAELRRITAPTVVVHGTKDILVRPSGGRATARAIPGAQLAWIKGMGHDLPAGAWPQIVRAIVSAARRAPLARAQAA